MITPVPIEPEPLAPEIVDTDPLVAIVEASNSELVSDVVLRRSEPPRQIPVKFQDYVMEKKKAWSADNK